ncbi:hypothetical protein C3007_09185 [Avibacterium gallinarum]|uniref:Uncharacterized protein n=1 Tax=Avibacterium gallinarum TaxID=755 RepID=A0A379AXP5_AVIGA|nr:hypothetical protein C3007_09185 [Avibacterium gallinarum]TDP28353.1 hypothetical protein EV689_106129 [Avibacterium gallinarum]SUB27117.1 Uncharacterised protein [Avibacterium gallinarum]
MKEKNKFYLDCLIFAILSYVLFLVYDLLITIYAYIKYDFYINLSFKKAFKAWICIAPLTLLLNWLKYKYGKNKK